MFPFVPFLFSKKRNVFYAVVGYLVVFSNYCMKDNLFNKKSSVMKLSRNTIDFLHFQYKRNLL
jgi:hypothetical protein